MSQRTIVATLTIEATDEHCDPSCRYLASPWDTGTHPDGKPAERQERYCHVFRVAIAKADRGAIRCAECLASESRRPIAGRSGAECLASEIVPAAAQTAA